MSISVTINDVKAARIAIRDLVHYTPCPHSPRLSERIGCDLQLKMENLQRTGSYKDRGSMNAILNLDEKQRKAGVITASAGNHAQGLAFAAQKNNIPAVICMPETAPLAKVRGTLKFGAQVVQHGNGFDDALVRARELQKEKGYTFVHAFDDPHVIAGQGTVGLELLEQNPHLEVFVVPVGGGGLIAGMALVLKETNPRVRVIGVQAESMDAMKVSMAAGEITTVTGTTIADGIAVGRPGEHNFPIIQKYVDEIVTVTEDEIAQAVMVLLESEKTVTEGSGAAAVAALLNNKIPDIAGKQVCAVLTGGNIDVTFLGKLVERGLADAGRLAKFSIIAPDTPSSIVDIASVAAEHKASILDLHHGSPFTSAQYRETEIVLLVEVAGPEEAASMLAAFNAKGYQARDFKVE